VRPIWACTICKEPLVKTGGSFACSNEHSFDLAREGYVNLLVGRQRSGHKGDAADMLLARRRFLGGGHYEPLLVRLIEIVRALGCERAGEAGCGEGYYIGRLSETLRAECSGYDIAKDGVKMAAKAYRKASFAVADTNAAVPFATASLDVLLDIFAPRNMAEFARVVKPGGHLVVVIPSPDHLAELRQIQPLLAIQDDKQAQIVASATGHFELVSKETLSLPLILPAADLADLVGMTPNAWFLTQEQKEKLATLPEVKTTAEFEILLLRQNAA